MTDSFGQRIIRCSIDWSAQGLKLVNFLAGRFTYRTADEWTKRISCGEITVNGKAVQPDYLLNLQDSVEYHPSDIPEPPAELNFREVYRDNDVMVVDKPGNLCVHPAGPFYRHTLWYLLHEKFREFYFLNRLDRETSGLMVVVFKAEMVKKLNRCGNLKKVYSLLVHGRFENPVVADGFLVSDTDSRVRKKRAFVEKLPEDKTAYALLHPEAVRTFFRPQGFFHLSGNKVISQLRVEPDTGRMHQIRATVRSLGFPVVGDKLYGPDERFYLMQREDSLGDAEKEQLILPRQALHSAELAFTHPVSGVRVALTSPAPWSSLLPGTEYEEFNV